MPEEDPSVKRYSNRDVAEVLANVADILLILDANRFRIVAFQNAAEAIRTLGQDINTLQQEGQLQSISGVGKGIAAAVDELLTTGEVSEFEELYKKRGHFTPNLLQQELASFRELKGYLPQVVIIHINPALEEETGAELATVARLLRHPITLAYEGMQIKL